MSGPIRKVIGLTRARLEEYLDQLQPFNGTPETRIDCQNILGQIYHERNRIGNAVNLLSKKNEEWSNLLHTSEPGCKRDEQEIYDEWTKDEDEKNFLKLMDEGQEALDILAARLFVYETTLQNLDREEMNATRNAESSEAPSHDTSHQQTLFRVKLPQLQLPAFDGDPKRWIEYWDCFSSSVDSTDMPSVQKFNYLISTLKGRAHTAIEGIAITDANYAEAVAILKRRFGDDEVIKRHLYQQLNAVPPASHKTLQLRQTVESIERICQQLKSLGEDLNHPALMLLIQKKLPQSILIKLEEARLIQDDWNLEKMREFLHKLINIREAAFQLSGGSQEGAGIYQRSTARFAVGDDRRTDPFTVHSLQTASPAKRGGRFPCSFCTSIHFNDECPTFWTLHDRKSRAKELNLCFRCLKRGHSASNCRFNKPCLYCEGNHNRALCVKKFGEEGYQFNATGAERKPENTEKRRASEQGNGQPNPRPNIDRKGTRGTLQGGGPRISTVQVHAATEEEEGEDAEHDVLRGLGEISVNHSTLVPLQGKPEVILLTAKTTISNAEDTEKSTPAYVFFDSGSQKSFISKHLSDLLRLSPLTEEVLTIFTFGSKKPIQWQSAVVEVAVTLKNGAQKLMQLNVVPSVTRELKRIEWIKRKPKSHTEEKIQPDILIGADYYWELMEEKPVQQQDSLFVVPTKLGPLVCGKWKKSEEAEVYSCQMFNPIQADSWIREEELPVNIESFWNLEAIGIHDSPTTRDDDKALEKFYKTINYQNQRYTVSWPFKEGIEGLEDNFWLSQVRLKAVLARLQQQLSLLEKYNSILKEQEKGGIIEEAPDVPDGKWVHYLPHHPVIRPTKATTKIRIVYDASARARKTARSLNDCLYRGPVMLPDLCGILLRFRTHKNAIIADIEKAFLQIELHPPDRDVTRFVWVKDTNKEPSRDNTKIFRFKRVPFGVVSSPFLLSATVLHHLKKAQEEAELRRDDSTKGILIQAARNMYVDNLIVGVGTDQEALRIYQTMKDIFAEASMNIREWVSNAAGFQEAIKEKDRSAEQCPKVLGISWQVKEDSLTLSLQRGSIEQSQQHALTKRRVLRRLAENYDPLGLLTPAVLPGKLCFQELWKDKYEWDEEIPPDQAIRWRRITAGWDQAALEVPRMIFDRETVKNLQIHTFVDASAKAYAGALYLRYTKNKDQESDLIFAKSRLCPRKGMTIPRLELMALLIGTRMTEFVERELHLPICRRVIWSDSISALKWLDSTKILPVFVENRVREIRKKTNIEFRYVNTKDNPADLATRGLALEELKHSRTWWKGPAWLANADEEWPQTLHRELPEEETNVLAVAEQERNSKSGEEETAHIIPLERFSSWPRAKRATAYLLRFVKIALWSKLPTPLKNKYPTLKELLHRARTTGPLVLEEIQRAEKFLIRREQGIHFKTVIQAVQQNGKDQLKDQLGIHIRDGILRCMGRYANTEISEDAKFPILLPRKGLIAPLIIRDVHKKALHSGVQTTLSELRRNWWIPQGRTAVKLILNRCQICKRHTTGPYKLPEMPALPKFRAIRCRPFQTTGVDYMGPVWVKSGDPFPGEKTKAWICLFTCTVTRCLHLELVCDLSTASFLNAFRRFIARRGRPDRIISDNASTFKAAANALAELWNNIHTTQDVVSYFTTNGIHWDNIPESGPWAGGFYERMVAIVKSSLKRSIGRSLLQKEAFATLLCEVEAVVNSRPLTFLYNDIKSRVLRPVDFLLPEAKVGMVPLAEAEEREDQTYQPPETRSDFVKLIQETTKTLDKFWSLWHEEYLLSLREKQRMQHRNPRNGIKGPPQIGDVVIIREDHLTRGSWKLGKICHLKIGEDGHARTAVVEVSVSNGNGKQQLVRPISLLHPVEAAQAPEETRGTEPIITHKGDTSPASAVKNKQQTTRPHGYNLRSLTKTLITVATIILTMTITAAARKCNPDEKGERNVLSQCSPKSYIAVKTSTKEICWAQVTCPTGHVKDGGICGPKCPCPRWAQGCSHYDGHFDYEPPRGRLEKNGTENYYEVVHKIAHAKLTFCSTKKDPRCSSVPTHIQGNQIELFDGSTHLVKNLELNMRQIEPDQTCRCFGDGEAPATGTPEYCQENQCEERSTTLCYYDSREIPMLVTDYGTLPVRAWGSIPLTVYGFKTQEEEDKKSCEKCVVQCTPNGAQIHVNETSATLEVCSQPYCYFRQQEDGDAEVQFPKEVLIRPYAVKAKIWINGFLVKRVVTWCKPVPVCTLINCYFCTELLLNPGCAPRGVVIVAGVMTYMALLFIYMFLKIALMLGGTVKCVGGGACTLLRVLRWIARRICGWAYHKIKQPRRLAKASGQYNNGYGYVRAGRTKRTVSTIPLIAVISLFIPQSTACARFTSLTAQATECFETAEKGRHCVISSVSRLSLAPQGQQACLIMIDSHNNSLGTISVEVQRIGLECHKKSEYFTRSFQMKTDSSKRCSLAGSCKDNKCESIRTDSKIPEFNGIANDSPGSTYCMESSGGISSGCFLPTYACLFYRNYATVVDDKIYEVFTCPIWETFAEATITILRGTEKSERTVKLKPGYSLAIEEIQLALPTVSLPPTPITSNQFLADGERYSLVKAAHGGQPIQGMIGQMQCSSRDKANRVECFLAPNLCDCHSAGERVACLCNSQDLGPVMRNKETSLPIQMAGISIFGTKDSVEASYEGIASLEMEIKLQGITLQATSNLNLCNMEITEMEGCYDCNTGATMSYRCRTNFGKALAYVSCGERQFTVICDPRGERQQTIQSFSEPNINLQCTVSCPAGKTNFILQGTLTYVQIEKIQALSEHKSTDNHTYSYALELPGLSALFSTPLQGIKIFLVAIACLFLSIAIARICLVGLSIACSTAGSASTPPYLTLRGECREGSRRK